MSRLWQIALGEWCWLLRSRLTPLVLVFMLLLVVAASANTALSMKAERNERLAYQQAAEEAFRTQPDRHPHRMVHYGHYVFRTPAPLAMVDPGVDAFTGRSIFLEGHRRNTATFAEARETSVLTRFGALTPAFTLQVLMPLLLILAGFATVVRERQGGMLTPLLLQGISPGMLVAGKVLAHAALALLMLLPLLMVSFYLWLSGQESANVVLILISGYALYLAFWVLCIVLVSTVMPSARTSLSVLFIFWLLSTVLLPRFAADMAASLVPMETLAETDIQISEEMRRIGDSHNISDPAFAAFRESILADYDVSSEEELPINFRGLVSMQNEEEGSAMMAEFAARRARQQADQAAVLQRFSWLSPLLAIRHFSLHLAGTGLDNHQRFVEQAEEQRYALVQTLNRLHMEELDYQDDSARSRDADAEQRTRISQDFWSRLQDFRYQTLPGSQRLLHAMPLLLLLLLWTLAVLGLLYLALRKRFAP